MTSLLIVGAEAYGTLRSMLTDALGSAVGFIQDVANSDVVPVAELIIGIHAKGAEGAKAFDAWAQTVGIPTLGVEVGIEEAIIGPLALSHRAGCGHCARLRMTGASAGADLFAEVQSKVVPVHDFSVLLARVLVHEIRAILCGHQDESRLLDHVLVCEFISGRTSLHRFIPMSHCVVCGGASARAMPVEHAGRLSAQDPPESVLQALAGWVDGRTGVISRIVLELPADASSELPIIATTSPPHTVEEAGSIRRLPIGWGKGLTLSEAILSAVGEAIERYAASLPDPARINWSRPDDLEGEILDPRLFALYTEEQFERVGFPYVQFDPKVRHPWVLGKWLGSNTPVWIPAVFAFLSLKLSAEHQICQGTSNGLAASTEPADAAMRATLELIERDAFMVAWLTACPGRRVAVDSGFDPQLTQVLESIEALGARVELYILPTAAYGTAALCLALGDGEQYPGVTIGLGADLDAALAIRQAILEVAQTGPHLRRLMRSQTLPALSDPSCVQELLHHAAYYFPVEHANAFDRLRCGDAPIAFGDLVVQEPSLRSLECCAAGLEAASVRVAVVDVSSPDVATGPFRVVRAISPDLQGISYGYGFDHPPVQRIRVRGLDPSIPAICPIW